MINNEPRRQRPVLFPSSSRGNVTLMCYSKSSSTILTPSTRLPVLVVVGLVPGLEHHQFTFESTLLSASVIQLPSCLVNHHSISDGWDIRHIGKDFTASELETIQKARQSKGRKDIGHERKKRLNSNSLQAVRVFGILRELLMHSSLKSHLVWVSYTK